VHETFVFKIQVVSKTCNVNWPEKIHNMCIEHIIINFVVSGIFDRWSNGNQA